MSDGCMYRGGIGVHMLEVHWEIWKDDTRIWSLDDTNWEGLVRERALYSNDECYEHLVTSSLQVHAVFQSHLLLIPTYLRPEALDRSQTSPNPISNP